MITKLAPRLLNKEVDEILVKPNEFVDAVNVKIDGIEGTDSGIIKFADGNGLISFASGLESSTTIYETIVGVCEDERDDRIYVFAAGATADSVYMIYDDGGEYVMRVLARSEDLGLDADNFVATDIIRIYNTEIESTGSDGGSGGFFDDNVEITDFPDDTIIIPQEEDEGQTGFANLVVIESISYPSEIVGIDTSFGATTSYNVPLPNTTLFVQNIGTAPTVVTVSGSMSSSNSFASLSVNIDENVGFGGTNEFVFTIPAGGSQFVTVDTGIVGGEPGDSVTLNVVVSATIIGFTPLEYSTTTVVIEAEVFEPQVEYLPNPSLTQADFTPVPQGVASEQVREYTIKNTTPVADGSFSPHLVGRIENITSDGSTAAATFLRYIDLNDFSVTEDDVLEFDIPPGAEYNFQFYSVLEGLEDPFIGQSQIAITYYEGQQYPQLFNQPPPPAITSPGVFTQVTEVINEEEEYIPPLLTLFTNTSWNGTQLQSDPLAIGGGLDYPGLSTGSTYFMGMQETGGVSDATVNVTHQFSFPDDFEWSGNAAELFSYGFAVGAEETQVLTQSSFHSLSLPAGLFGQYFYNLYYVQGNSSLALTSEESFIDALQSYGADLQMDVTVTFENFTQDGTSTVGSDTFSIIFEPIASEGFLYFEPKRGVWGLSTNAGSPSTYFSAGVIDAGWDPLNGREPDFIMSAYHNGNVASETPAVRITNTRTANVSSLGGIQAGNNTYLQAGNYNSDYSDNDVVWSGEGMGKWSNSGNFVGDFGDLLWEAGLSGFGDHGLKILPLGYYGNDWTNNKSDLTYDRVISGGLPGGEGGGWSRTNPNNNLQFYNAYSSPSYPSSFTGFTDTDGGDTFSFRKYNPRDFRYLNPDLDVWWIDDGNPGYDGSVPPTNPKVVTEIEPNQRVFCALSFESTISGDHYAEVQFGFSPPYDNGLGQFLRFLFSYSSGGFRTSSQNRGSEYLPPPQTTMDSGNAPTSPYQPNKGSKPAPVEKKKKPLRIKKPKLKGSRIRKNKY